MMNMSTKCHHIGNGIYCQGNDVWTWYLLWRKMEAQVSIFRYIFRHKSKKGSGIFDAVFQKCRSDLSKLEIGSSRTFLSGSSRRQNRLCFDLVPINLKNGLVKRKTQHEFGTFRVIPAALKAPAPKWNIGHSAS